MSNKEIDNYIASFPDEIQNKLIEIRNALNDTLAGAEDKMSYSIPTFKYKKNLIQYAAYKNHIGIFAEPVVISEFEDVLKEKGFKYSKSGFQINNNDELPLELIKEIALWAKGNIL